VDDAAAGRGVGRAVVSTNERAVRLWRSLDFEIIGTVPGAFRHRLLGPVDLHGMYRGW
jgi:ribosomal protein S18 acetylase RimI-like enzyme